MRHGDDCQNANARNTTMVFPTISIGRAPRYNRCDTTKGKDTTADLSTTTDIRSSRHTRLCAIVPAEARPIRMLRRNFPPAQMLQHFVAIQSLLRHRFLPWLATREHRWLSWKQAQDYAHEVRRALPEHHACTHHRTVWWCACCRSLKQAPRASFAAHSWIVAPSPDNCA